MAERPVFAPVHNGRCLIREVPISFVWHPGMAPTQKKKNVAALHEAACRKGLHPLLEVSSKSNDELGRRLSAFYLPIKVNGRLTTLESAYQGSKIFEHGGPFYDIYDRDSRDAKRDPRVKQSGRLIRFRFEGHDFPLSPATAFYDWLYAKAIFPHRDWLRRLEQYAGFTDIEFNPERSLNCQARSCATFVALEQRGWLDDVVASFEAFKEAVQHGAL